MHRHMPKGATRLHAKVMGLGGGDGAMRGCLVFAKLDMGVATRFFPVP